MTTVRGPPESGIFKRFLIRKIKFQDFSQLKLHVIHFFNSKKKECRAVRKRQSTAESRQVFTKLAFA